MAELPGLKVPVPLPDQVPDPVEEYPFNMATGLVLQTAISDPAFTRGAELKLMSMVLVVALQLPLDVVLKVITTLPAVVSAGLAA